MNPFVLLAGAGLGGALLWAVFREKSASAAVNPAVLPSSMTPGGGPPEQATSQIIPSFPFQNGVPYAVQILADMSMTPAEVLSFAGMGFGLQQAAPQLIAQNVTVRGANGASSAANRWTFLGTWKGPSGPAGSWSPQVAWEAIATIPIPSVPPPPDVPAYPSPGSSPPPPASATSAILDALLSDSPPILTHYEFEQGVRYQVKILAINGVPTSALQAFASGIFNLQSPPSPTGVSFGNYPEYIFTGQWLGLSGDIPLPTDGIVIESVVPTR